MRTFDLLRPNSIFFDVEKANLGNFFKPGHKLHTTEESYGLALEVPGIKKEDIKIELKENNLKVAGTKYDIFDPEKKAEFVESFIIPKDTLVDSIKVNLDYGVLLITIPRDVQVPETKILEIN